MTAIIAAAALAFAVQAPLQKPAADPRCNDPAIPMLRLAAEYDRWPARPRGDRATRAWALLNTYMKSDAHLDYKRALFEYEKLEVEFPRDMHIKLALAVLYTAGSDLNFKTADGYRNVVMTTYSNADTRAARLWQEILNRDSTQWLAPLGMTRVALVTTEKGRMDPAYEGILRALSADPANVGLHLAWSDLLVREGATADALKYIQEHTGDCVAQQHALAEALMLNGDTARGSRLYISTLERTRPEELDRFFDDARVMMSVGQVRAYRELPEAQKPAWLRAYWSRTAAASGRTLETRVAEHLVRTAYANTNHRTHDVQGRLAKNRLAVLSDTSHVVPWDAAGIYFVRHGPPDTKYYVDTGSGDFETWIYRQMEPPVILLMGRLRHPPSDWEAADVPPCPFNSFVGRWDKNGAEERIRTGKDLTVRDVYYAISDIDPRYGELVRECMLAVGMKRLRLEDLLVDFRYENVRLHRKLVNSESSLPHFSKPVHVAVAAYEFRNVAREPEVIALSWIPMADLRDASSQSSQLRLTYSVADSLVGSMSKDTTISLPNTTSGLVRVPVVWRNPSVTNGTLRITAVDPADTLRGATRTTAFRVKGDKADVALSDVVLADADADGPLVRGSHRIAPIPEHRIKPGDKFRVFAELYGAKSGEPVQTTIHIQRRYDNSSMLEQLRLTGRDERNISMTDPAVLDSRGVAVLDVEVTGDLIRGTYTMEIRALTGGKTALRTATFIVE